MKELNYKTTGIVAVKSVPMFPKGIQRNLDRPGDDFSPLDTGLDYGDEPAKLDDANTDNGKTGTEGKQTDEGTTGKTGTENVDNTGTGTDTNQPTPIDFTADTFTVDEKGLVNSKGEVVKTLEDLEKEGYVDADNNIINPTTKEVVINTSAATQNVDVPLIQEIQQELGYEIADDKGVKKVYEDTTKGLAEYVADAAKVIAKKEQADFFNAMPEVRDYARHLSAGGTRDSYFNYAPKDYASVDLATLDVEQKAQIVYENYIKKNVPEALAKKLVEGHKKDNEIDAESATALTELVAAKKAFDVAEDAKVLKVRQQEEKEQKEYWDGVQAKVKDGVLNNISIPVADRENFIAYISKTVGDTGKTQNAIDASKEDVGYQLQSAYMRFKKYDLTTLASSLVKKQQVKTLREKITADKGVSKANNQTRDIKDNAGKSVTFPSLDTIDQ